MTSSSSVGWRLAPRSDWPPRVERAQGHALVKLHVLADQAGFADHDAGAVIDEEIVADRGPGVDVDAGEIVCVFGHDPRDQRHLLLVQFMGDAVDADGKQAGIGKNDFVGVSGGRVAIKRRLHIGGERGAERREGAEEFLHDGVGGGIAGGAIVRRGASPGGGWRCAPAGRAGRESG